MELGQTLRRSGKNAQAFGIFRRASDLDRANPDHLVSAADALWADGRKSAAIAFLRKAVQIDSQKPGLLHRLASSLAAVGLTNDSLPYYEQAVKLAPADPDLGLEAAQAAFRAGDLEKADAWKETGTGENSSADGLVLKARIAMQKGDYKKAISLCEPITAAHPGDARGWALLAQALSSGAEDKSSAGSASHRGVGAAQSRRALRGLARIAGADRPGGDPPQGIPHRDPLPRISLPLRAG